MSDFGQLFYLLVLFGAMSLFDALARRARRRQIERMERQEREQPEEAPERARAERPVRRPRSAEPRSTGPDLQELDEALEELIRGPVAAEERAQEERAQEQRIVDERMVEDREAEPELLPLVVVPDEARQTGRKEPRERSVRSVSKTDRPGRGAPATSRRAPASGRSAALRSALRGDPAALRRAVIYREILGPPLGARRAPGGWEEKLALPGD